MSIRVKGCKYKYMRQREREREEQQENAQIIRQMGKNIKKLVNQGKRRMRILPIILASNFIRIKKLYREK